MHADLKRELIRNETDLTGVLERFADNETFYVACLAKFMEDGTMDDLDRALAARNWDDAFTAAHALKGLAGNMGFVPLFHSAAEMVVLIRSGRTGEIDGAYREMRKNYRRITGVIDRYCATQRGE